MVTALFEDSRKRLWVGAGGLSLYDREKDRFDYHPQARAANAGADFVIRAIREDRQGRLWLATEGEGLFRYDPEQRVSKRYVNDPRQPGSLSHDAAIGLLCDRQGRIWIGTRRGLDRYDPGSDSFVHALEAPGVPERLRRASAEALFVESLYEAQDGALWLGTMGEGLIRFDPEKGTAKQYLPDPADPDSLSGRRISALTGDGAATIYVAVENEGLDVLDARTGRFIHHRPDLEDPTSLASASLWCLMLDDQGILWIGTYNAGLDYISPLGQRFGLLRARRGGLSDPHVTAVIEDHLGNLWIGSDGGGLNRLDRKTGRFTYYRKNRTDPNSLASDSVVSLLEDRRHSIWFGTWAGGLHRLDPGTGRIERIRRGPDGAEPFADWTIVEDAQGDLILGQWSGGAQLLDPMTRKFTPLSRLYPGVTGSGEVFAIAEDGHGRLWLGGTFGLEVVDRNSGRIERHPLDLTDPESLVPGTVYAIRPDSRGNVWIGTEGGGLTCFEAGTGRSRRYTRAEGLPPNDIADILEDREGSLWLGTSRGLIKFETGVRLPQVPRFFVFDVYDGLQGYEFRHGAAFKSRSGEMFFGGQRGLSFFFPENVRRNPAAPRVVLTELRVFNRPVGIAAPGSPLEKAISETSDLRLSYRHSVVTFGFAALNFILPQKNQYQYKLEGFEPGWNRVGTQHTASYTNLPAGSYALRVRASNNDGVWNQEGLTLRLHVYGPWWQAGWFRLIVAAVLGAVALLAYRARIHGMETRRRELEVLVERRTGELRGEIAERKLAQESVNRLNEVLGQRVTERTAELATAYENLSAEKDRLAVTLRSIADGMIATDVQGQVTLMNRVAEDLTGWPMAEAIDRPLSEVLRIVDRQTRKPLPSPAEEVLARAAVQVLQTDTLLVARSGRELLIADSAAPIRDRESRVVGVVVVFRDVTERQRVDERLRNAQKLEALGVLAGGLAHDFNNLLTGIFGYVEIARRKYRAQHDPGGPLDKSLSVLDKARGLTRQLLTFSRAGQPVTAPLAVGQLLRNSAQFALSGSNVSHEIQTPDDLWLCEADEQQIDQVIDNLLLNARQAMSHGGMVTLSASNFIAQAEGRPPLPEGRYVRLEIRDQGEGIPGELLSRIFEPFFTTKATGSGLGLATAYSIVRKHGGHIEVESEPGVGSLFTVYLPASSAGAAARPQTALRSMAGRGRVLVVDDEDYVCDVVSQMLTGLGYSVQTVRRGEEAVAMFEKTRATDTPFDLVILDLTVPGGMGGIATLARLCTIDPHVRAIAASGYSRDPVMANPAAYGFRAALVKPFTEAELSAVLSSALERPRG
jgi:PAS domain S-box-containing protein